MKLAASETFRNLKLKQYKKLASAETVLTNSKQYFTMPALTEVQSGILAPKRVNQVELFKKYTYQVLPTLEQSVELDLLERIFQKVEPIVKESLIQSYIRKQVQLYQQTPDESSILGFPDNVASNQPREKAQIFEKSISNIGQEKIGKWIAFTYEEYKVLFKHKSPGDFLNNFLKYTKNYSLLLTDEGFKTIDFIDSIGIDHNIYSELKNVDEADYKTDDVFIFSFNLLKGYFAQAIKKYRNDPTFEKLFSSSVVFDSILSIIITEYPYIEEFETVQGRTQFFEDLVEQIKSKVDPKQPNGGMPDLFCKTVKSLQVGKLTIDLLKYADNTFPCPETLKQRFENYQGFGSNLMFYGDHGSGKSGVLMQAIMFAKSQKALIVVVPSGFDWTQSTTKLVRHHETGLCMQPKLAVQWLEQFRHGNEELLKQFKVDQSIYGKYNLSGVHDNDPEAVPNLYDEKRKYYFKEYQKFLLPEEIDQIIDDNQRMSVRLTLKIPNPVNLLEIIDYGIANEFYSTNVIYEALEQIYNQEQFKVVIAVDGFNWFYRPSCYPSFRYETNKELRGHIPPYHLSLCRAFMHLDGHKIKNGIKLTASSIYRLHLHNFEPKHIYVPNQYGIKLKGMPLDHFKSFCEYALQTGLWRSDIFGMNTQEQFWVETQGNYAETIKCMREHWRDI